MEEPFAHTLSGKKKKKHGIQKSLNLRTLNRHKDRNRNNMDKQTWLKTTVAPHVEVSEGLHKILPTSSAGDSPYGKGAKEHTLSGAKKPDHTELLNRLKALKLFPNVPK